MITYTMLFWGVLSITIVIIVYNMLQGPILIARPVKVVGFIGFRGLGFIGFRGFRA